MGPRAWKRPLKRVFCPECGAVRIRHGRSTFAVCPHGHGRLVPRFTHAECDKAIASQLRRARRVGRRTFAIAGRKGPFVFRNGNGRRRAAPDAKVQADEVVARYVTPKRTLIRVFTRRAPRKTKGPT